MDIEVRDLTFGATAQRCSAVKNEAVSQDDGKAYAKKMPQSAVVQPSRMWSKRHDAT